MNHSKNTRQLEKLLFYVLGKRPDEFGLLPDSDGYVKIRELVRAVCEEDGYRYFRDAHIKEIILTADEPVLEIFDDRIRAVDRSGLQKFDNEIPKLLFYSVKRKTYQHIMEKGLYPDHGNTHVILSSDRNMAIRIGKRRDNDPVSVAVPTSVAVKEGVDLERKGESLYISVYIPPSCISGPPVEKIIGQQPERDTKKKKPVRENQMAGSFIMKPLNEEDKNRKQTKDRGEWKNAKKRLRREKKSMWPDE